MNLFGKILVVLVMLLSVAFLGVAIAVFSSHTNWKAKIDAQKEQITELTADLDTLQTQYKVTDSNLQLEIEAAQHQALKLERERVALAGRNANAQSEIDTLKQERRDLTKAVADTQDTVKQLAGENRKLQQDIESNIEATNTAFTSSVEATSELHEAKMKLETQLERSAQLVEQVGASE